MSDEKIKALIDVELDSSSKDNLTKAISDAISGGLNNSSTRKSFEEMFKGKNVKKNFTSNIIKMFTHSEKSQEKQNKLANEYSKQQTTINKLISTQGKGLGGNLKLVGAIGKQGVIGIKGIAAALGPVGIAVAVISNVVTGTINQLERIAKDSAKFVGQGSIFTDKQTMGMMQKTGQTATQAQGTQRSLDALGISFEDVQSGKLTQEQAALFEELRAREISKVEEVSRIAGPMMKSLQQITLAFTLVQQDINDWITMAMSASPGIKHFLGSIKGILGQIGPFIQSIIGVIMPIVSVIFDVIASIMDIASSIMPIITLILQLIAPIMGFISQFISTVLAILTPIIQAVITLVSLFAKFLSIFNILNPILEVFTGLLASLSDVFQPVVEAISGFIGWIVGLVNSVIGTLKGFNILGWKPFEDMELIDVEGLKGSMTNPGASYENQTNNNYIYGNSGNGNNNNNQNSNGSLFTNSYTLVND